MAEYTFDTIVVGAGLAGIAAARTLEQDNRAHGNNDNAYTPYVVLEADSKIGGRVQSKIIETPDKKKIIINPGAQWIHRDVRDGAPENPLLPHVLASGDLLIRDPMPREFWNRGKMDNFVHNNNLIKAARKKIDAHKGPDTDLEALFTQHGLGIPSSLITTFGEVETGAPLRAVSTADVHDLVACNLGDFTRKGLGAFVEHFAKDVMPHIRLNTKIKEIHWQPGGGVDVYTQGGDVYHAKRCILTVSIGVLKSGDIEFKPKLPRATRDQLSHIRMGDFNKIFLVFDPKFRFPVNHNTHLDVRTREGDDIFYLARDNGQPLVTAFLGGEQAVRCDRDLEGAREFAINKLCEIWGDKIKNQRHIIDSHVTQWGNNPLIRGGYSRVDIGHHRVREKLAQPIGDAIYLAGEAVGAKHPESGRNWATHMAGAALSGERAANLVLKEREKESPTSYRKALDRKNRGNSPGGASLG